MASLLSSVWACILGNLFLRIGSAAAGTAISLNLAYMGRTTGGVDATVVGLISVAFYLSELVTAPFFGTLSDRYGRQRFMLLGTFLGLIAVLILPWVAAVPLFIAARSLEGFSSGSSVPAVLGHLAAETGDSPRTRGKVMAIFEVTTILGLALGYGVGGFFFDQFHSLAFFLIAGIYGLSFLLFTRVVSSGQDAEATTRHKISPEAYGILLRDKPTVGFLPAWIAVNAVLGVWGTHLAFQMASDKASNQLLVGGYTGTQIGIASALIGVALIVGTGLWTVGFGRIRTLSIMVVATFGIIGMSAVLLALNHSPAEDTARIYGLLGLTAVGMLVASGFTPAALAYLAEQSERFPEHRGSLMGLYSVLIGGGQLIGSWAGGYFASAWAVDGLVYLTAILGGLALAGLFFVIRTAAHESPSYSQTH